MDTWCCTTTGISTTLSKNRTCEISSVFWTVCTVGTESVNLRDLLHNMNCWTCLCCTTGMFTTIELLELHLLHDFNTETLLLAMPGNFIRSRPVQSETEWRFLLPHLSRHTVVLTTSLPSHSLFFHISLRQNAPSFPNSLTKTVSVNCFCREKLDLGIRVAGLYHACGARLCGANGCHRPKLSEV